MSLHFRALMIVLSLLQEFAWTAVFITGTPDMSQGSLVLLSLASAFLLIGPVFSGSFVAAWWYRGSAARTRLKRTLAVVIGVQIIGAAALIGFAVTAGASPLFATLDIVISFGLTALFIALGRVDQRRDDRLHGEDPWADDVHTQIRKAYRNAAIGFGVGALLGIVGLGIVGLLLADSGKSAFAPSLALEALAFALLGGMLGIVSKSFPIARRVRQAAGNDLTSSRRIRRVVMQRKPDTLSDAEQLNASRYAQVIGSWLPLQIIQFGLLYAALLVQQLSSFLDDHDFSAFRIGLTAFLVIALAIFVPFMAVRAGNARRYAAAHPPVSEPVTA